MKVFYNEDSSLRFEVMQEAVDVHYNGEVYEIYKDGDKLGLRRRTLVSFSDFIEKKEKTPPYANSWDYHTYIKSEDCDG